MEHKADLCSSMLPYSVNQIQGVTEKPVTKSFPDSEQALIIGWLRPHNVSVVK